MISKDKIKVCIISAILPPAYAGADIAAFNYAKRLNSSPDAEAIVIGWDRDGTYEKSKVKYDFVYPVKFPERPENTKGILIYFHQYLYTWNCFWVLFGPMWKVRKKYDYIHNFSSGWVFKRVAIFIAKILGKRVITEASLIGDDDPIALGRFLSWDDYLKPKFLWYLFYRMADCYVSKSVVITEMFKKAKMPMHRVVQIPYSVDVSKFGPLNHVEKKNLRNKLGLWEEGLILIFVGGIIPRKGVHLLIDAFISIEKKYPDLRLLLVGPTNKYEQEYTFGIRRKIKDSNLSDKIRLTEENVNNVSEYMQCADIFILPSKWEGLPISIIEAMSCGLAVVASDIPEISRAQIDNGKNGFVFPVGNTKELIKTLEKLIENKENISKIGNEARKKAVNNWSTEIVDKAYRELYRK